MTDFFKDIPAVKYAGPDSQDEFVFRHYNPDEIVMGKRMEDGGPLTIRRCVVA